MSEGERGDVCECVLVLGGLGKICHCLATTSPSHPAVASLSESGGLTGVISLPRALNNDKTMWNGGLKGKDVLTTNGY